jgi:PIN domain nuclease of toxin-antitoxin system
MILLDSHVIIWMFGEEHRLSGKAREAILRARSTGETLAYSPVSLYEIAYAGQRKRLPLVSTVKELTAGIESELESVSLSNEIVLYAAQIPAPFHGDSIDRFIVATAVVMDCPLVTHDGKIREANLCKLIW